MRAAIDTALITLWISLVISALLWALITAFPEGSHGEALGRIIVLAFPLISAWRVHHNYQVARAKLWFFGLWVFSLVFASAQWGDHGWILHYDALIMAALLFILLPVPMARVWGELRRVWRKICANKAKE